MSHGLTTTGAAGALVTTFISAAKLEATDAQAKASADAHVIPLMDPPSDFSSRRFSGPGDRDKALDLQPTGEVANVAITTCEGT
jgi:hypothetical protein